jgi:hypothetical protein
VPLGGGLERELRLDLVVVRELQPLQPPWPTRQDHRPLADRWTASVRGFPRVIDRPRPQRGPRSPSRLDASAVPGLRNQEWIGRRTRHDRSRPGESCSCPNDDIASAGLIDRALPVGEASQIKDAIPTRRDDDG